jgi:guanylate kinase
MSHPKLFIISSVAGGGKSTIISKILSEHPDFFFSISCTTRAPRPGDEEGKTYYFLSVPQFKKKIEEGEFYEWAEVHGNFYGTPKTPILQALAENKRVILDLDVQGAKSVKTIRPDSITIFIEPPSREIWIERLIRRGTDSQSSIEKRIQNGFKELDEAHTFDYIVVNDILEDAVQRVKDILLKF